MRLFGAHVSTSGGFHRALEAAQALEVNSIQVHPSAPQKWNTNPYEPGFESKFLELLPGSGVQRVFFHAIYLINLATPKDSHRNLSRLSLVHYLDLLGRIGGSGVIVHVGSLKDEPDEARGLSRAADSINRVMEKAPASSRLLLEVAAGSGEVIGDRVEELATIYAEVEDKDRVGFALDTQHLWASGYDLQNELDSIVDHIDQVLGLARVSAIHLNDSKTALASRKDRHENLGQGMIGAETLTRVVNHPKLRDIPFVLETPGLKTPETARQEVDALRAMLQ